MKWKQNSCYHCVSWKHHASNHRDTCTSIVFSQQDGNGTTRKRPPMDEWTKKMQFRYAVEFYSAVKKNEIVTFSEKWMELQITIEKLLC